MEFQPIAPIVMEDELPMVRYSGHESVLKQLQKSEIEVVTKVLVQLLNRKPLKADFKRVERKFYANDFMKYEFWFDTRWIGIVEIITPSFFERFPSKPESFYTVQFTPLSYIVRKESE